MTTLGRQLEQLPERLTVDQLAGLLGVGRGTAYNWLHAGHIPAYKLGGSWVIVRDEVKEHLARVRNRPLAIEDGARTES